MAGTITKKEFTKSHAQRGEWECSVHGVFMSSEKNIIRANTPCPSCRQVETMKSRITVALTTHGDSFSFMKVNLLAPITENVTIVCGTHGDIQMPISHFISNKHGCRKCGEVAAAKAKRKDLQYFTAEANKVHNNFYDYTSTIYVEAKVKLKIRCPLHGEFEQLASGHLQGYGCKMCASYGKGRVSPTVPCILYYFRIAGTSLYKVGITTRSLDERYRTKFDRDQIDLIFTKKYSTGAAAYEAEQAIHREFTKYKYKGDKILKTGNTEIYTKDILKGHTIRNEDKIDE